ncbi:hypothetical protein CNMCM8980_001759 [Aspergillus fumigatiaffinis]|uniref:Carrier domain-containing protein n=1 Tax=Aspergillus fumigatiaffinis TaxID=340414 RepID=A0A8H4GU00_9EURO|nr:hypothetical protein CNMCM6805_002150 [Aspergillus fumigatiaffinis]KAF4239309.1 hypothetical protein CNMCM8980_001759 [Aspergillus fumigatiaffinis]
MTVDYERMRRLMAEALGLRPDLIQKGSNFFDMGGDSFSAQHLVSRARDEGVYLTMEDIFDHPTWSDFVRIVGEKAANASRASQSPHRNTGSEDHFRNLDGKIGDGFVAIYPTTDFQRFALFSMYFRYFRIPLPSTIDRARLLGACQQLVKRHESLRTAFYAYTDGGQEKVVQGILPPKDIQFKERNEAASSLDQYCEDDNRKTLEPPVDGKPPFQAHLVTLQDSSMFLVLRFTHAQWDGVSLASIAHDLTALYNGSLVPPASQFIDHARAAWASQTEEAYEIWRQLLRGSKMTVLRGHQLAVDGAKSTNGITADEPYTVQITKNIPLPVLPANISMATLVKAAWAIVLRRLFIPRTSTVCKQDDLDDVVFGQVTNARGLEIPHDESIVGPCANIVPVRVHFTETMTKLDLFHQVQRQYVRTRPAENVEFGKIVKHCTSWPSGTRYGSFVRFQNYDFSPTSWFNGVPCKGSLYNLPNRPSETANLAVFPLDTRLSLQLTVSHLTLSQKEADFVVNKFCNVVQYLGTGLQSTIASSFELLN